MTIDNTHPDSPLPKPTRLVILTILAMYIALAWLILLGYQADWPVGWTYVGLFIGCSTVFKSSFLFWNEELWWRRMDMFSNTKSWDWAVMAAFATSAFSILFTAVIDFDAPANDLDLQWLIGLAIFMFGWMFFTWCSFSNPFFDAMVRIQKDYGHCVMDEGPYSVIRHPGYVGFIATFLATPLLLPSTWIYVLSFVMALTLVIRTALEDRALQAELTGYVEYAARVRFRLVPGVW